MPEMAQLTVMTPMIETAEMTLTAGMPEIAEMTVSLQMAGPVMAVHSRIPSPDLELAGAD